MSQAREEVLYAVHRRTRLAHRGVLDLGAIVSPRVLKAMAGTGLWGQNDPKVSYHDGCQESKFLSTLL